MRYKYRTKKYRGDDGFVCRDRWLRVGGPPANEVEGRNISQGFPVSMPGAPERRAQRGIRPIATRPGAAGIERRTRPGSEHILRKPPSTQRKKPVEMQTTHGLPVRSL